MKFDPTAPRPRPEPWPAAQLFRGQGYAGYLRAIIPRESQRHAAPATADVEHRQAGSIEAELSGDVVRFGCLRFFERLGSLGEIGAGVMPVAI